MANARNVEFACIKVMQQTQFIRKLIIVTIYNNYDCKKVQYNIIATVKLD